MYHTLPSIHQNNQPQKQRIQTQQTIINKHSKPNQRLNNKTTKTGKARITTHQPIQQAHKSLHSQNPKHPLNTQNQLPTKPTNPKTPNYRLKQPTNKHK